MTATLTPPPAAPASSPPAAPPRRTPPAAREPRAPLSRAVYRFRLLAVCVVLTTVMFLQDPGQVAADTKLDLTQNPWGFLGRALHLWDPQGFFGQLQNQAYGYLFPMGPFFGLGHTLGIPAWIVQRTWWALLVCTALLGAVRLARLLGVESPAARVAAGLAYALAPRMITELGPISAEVLPMALAPWVLVPLAAAARGGSVRRGAALSGVAVLLAGGVNAIATAAMLPLAAWFLLTRTGGPRRRALAGWWVLAVALASTWWALPLLLLGRYSPPFLDWIESASITTGRNDPDAVLRGVTQWVAYVPDSGGPVWGAGWSLVATPLLVLATGLAAAVGLVGLARRGTPERLFLLGGVVLGIALLSFGHVGTPAGLGSAWAQAFLDAAGAPLRNVHKFDPVLRLPLAIGVGLAVQRALRPTPVTREAGPRGRVAWRTAAWRVVAAVGVAAVLVAALPAWTGALTRTRSFAALPEYWDAAAAYLAEQEPTGRALVVPGASFGVYVWGRTQDEPLQPLASSPWAVRDAVPLSSAGNIRWLDAIGARLEDGRGSPGLSAALTRAGISYLVVRNDLDRGRTASPRSVLVHQALRLSPGLVPVAGFGPVLAPYGTEDLVVDDGLQDAFAAVEVWRVRSPLAPPDPRVVLRDASRLLAVSGSAESVVDMLDTGALRTQPVVTDGDPLPDGVAATRAVTDGYARSEVNFGRVDQNRSAVMTTTDPYLQPRRVHDYEPVPTVGRQATAAFEGGTVSASSSGGDATALRARSASAQPWSAVDGDPATAWVSGDFAPGVGQWWEERLDAPVTADSVTVSFAGGDQVGELPTRVRLTTDAGEVERAVRPDSEPQRLSLPPGPTRSLRITLLDVVGGGSGTAFGLREVGLPGASVGRSVVTAGAAAGGPVVLTAARGERGSCVAVAATWACTPTLTRPGAERSGVDRVFSTGSAGAYRVAVRVTPRPGAGVDRLLEPLTGAMTATATSALVSDAPARAQAAVDGSLETAWFAATLDPKPGLTLRWAQPRRVTGLRLVTRPGLAASRPLHVVVRAAGRTFSGYVTTSGLVTFAPVRTTSLSFEVDQQSVVRTLAGGDQGTRQLPLALSEVGVVGAADQLRGPLPGQAVALPCGFGPTVRVDGADVPTSLRTTVGAVLAGGSLAAETCGPALALPAGEHRLSAPSTAELLVDSVALLPTAVDRPDARPYDAQPQVREWGAVARVVDVPAAAAARVLETTENANAGWTATLDGRPLQAMRVDGWRQAWLVPAGAGGSVELTFAPDSGYRLGLLVGLAAALGLLLLVLLPVRRRVDRAALRPRAAGRLLTVAAVLLVGATAGAPGLVVAAATALALAVPGAGAAAVVVCGGAGAAAAVLAATTPWPGRLDAPVPLLVALALLPVVAVVASASAPLRRRPAPVSPERRPSAAADPAGPRRGGA